MNSRRSSPMTSSARASTVGGISRPSALAVIRLMTRSYLWAAPPKGRPASRRAGLYRHNDPHAGTGQGNCSIGRSALRFQCNSLLACIVGICAASANVLISTRLVTAKAIGYDIKTVCIALDGPQLQARCLSARTQLVSNMVTSIPSLRALSRALLISSATCGSPLSAMIT